MTIAAKREIPFGRPWITEDDRRAVLAVLDGPILTHGPEGKAFEAEFSAFLGEGAHSITVSSGMAALHLAYLQFEIGPGDEVIVPAQTHSATANAVELVGARPVFVDCEIATGNMTAAAIAAALTPRTRAISVVHYAGIACDMGAIVDLARSRDLRVVEDCALAVGTRIEGTHVGLFGDAGCFSFYPVKHITTGEGGMFTSRHREVADSVARIRAHGVDRTHLERAIPGMYDVAVLGLNYRLGEMQAALGRAQLRRIDEILRRRAENFERLASRLRAIPGVRVIDRRDGPAVNSWYCLTVVLGDGLGERRNEVVTRLNALGVGTSVYYPQPVPRMSFYRGRYGYEPAAYRNAEAISDRSIALPVGPHLTSPDIDHVADSFASVVDEQS